MPTPVYYRDRTGRRRRLTPTTIYRHVHGIPWGYHITVYQDGPDQVGFGPPLSTSTHTLGPFIVEIPWRITKKDAEDYCKMIVEELQNVKVEA